MLLVGCFAVVNDDDSIAVKPTHGPAASQPFDLDCSSDMLIEDMVMTGVGASIGSVPPHEGHNCVRNITFRNITMPGTTKGIYVKSNPTCVPGNTAEIVGIAYENFRILSPTWWALWIGPQQQHEPKSALGRKCALDYPISSHCPTQGCVRFENLLLKDIYIEQPTLAPGVLLGNNTQPMKNVTFDNVVVKYTDGKQHKPDPALPLPISNTYEVVAVEGCWRGATEPVPQGFREC